MLIEFKKKKKLFDFWVRKQTLFSVVTAKVSLSFELVEFCRLSRRITSERGRPLCPTLMSY